MPFTRELAHFLGRVFADGGPASKGFLGVIFHFFHVFFIAAIPFFATVYRRGMHTAYG